MIIYLLDIYSKYVILQSLKLLNISTELLVKQRNKCCIEFELCQLLSTEVSSYFVIYVVASGFYRKSNVFHCYFDLARMFIPFAVEV